MIGINCCKWAKDLIWYDKKRKEFILMANEDTRPGHECSFGIDYCPWCGVRLISMKEE